MYFLRTQWNDWENARVHTRRFKPIVRSGDPEWEQTIKQHASTHESTPFGDKQGGSPGLFSIAPHRGKNAGARPTYTGRFEAKSSVAEALLRGFKTDSPVMDLITAPREPTEAL